MPVYRPMSNSWAPVGSATSVLLTGRIGPAYGSARMPERRSVAAAFVAAFLVVALAVPVIGLFRDRPASFSWHMYSAMGSLPDVWVVDHSGRDWPVNLDAVLASRRAEVDYGPSLFERLCADEHVASVRISTSGEEVVRSCD